MDSNMTSKQYQNMKSERDVVAKAHDVLKLGTFPGHLAETVAISQIYLKGLVERLDVEIAKEAPANEPLTAVEMQPVVEAK